MIIVLVIAMLEFDLITSVTLISLAITIKPPPTLVPSVWKVNLRWLREIMASADWPPKGTHQEKLDGIWHTSFGYSLCESCHNTLEWREEIRDCSITVHGVHGSKPEWDCSSVVSPLHSMYKGVGSIPSGIKRQHKRSSAFLFIIFCTEKQNSRYLEG